MARPKKTGLDYFPFDVDTFSDIKIRKLIKYQGGKAVAIYASLLCLIYKSGYYMRWDEELPFIISEMTGFEEAYISEVIKSCLALGLFSKELYCSAGILTSAGLQERYNSINKMIGRKCEICEYSLISSGVSSQEMGVSSQEMGGFFPENATNKIKEKETKRNKEKSPNGDKKKTASQFSPPSVEDVKAYVLEKGYSVDAVQFVNFYESKGWMVGKNKMKNWRAAVATWQNRDRASPQSKPQNSGSRYARNNDRHNGIADWQDE